MSKLFNIIENSPFDKLESHILSACECANLLVPFVDNLIDQNWLQAENINNEIITLESKADEIKYKMRLSLHKGLYLPVPRIELLNLIKSQDEISNLSQDIAGLMLGRKILIPKPIESAFLVLLNQSLVTCNMAKEAVVELKLFFASGFGGNFSDILENMINKINKMEHITDTCEVSVRSELFRIEDDLNPIEVMFLYKVISLIGCIADAAESVSDKIALILAE